MKRPLNRFSISTLFLALLSTYLIAASTPPDHKLVSGIDQKHNDPAIRVQDDFYRHVNGTWLKNTEIPADKSRWGAFNILADKVLQQMHEITIGLSSDKKIAGDSDEQKIRDAYESFMDTKAISALGLKPLDGIFRKVDNVSSKDQLPELIAYFNRVDITAPYNVSIHQDARDSTKYIVDLGQSGLGLPDRDYYLKDDDAKLRGLRDAYQKHIEKMLTMAGETHAKDNAATIMRLETALAKIQWTKVEQRDPVKSYNKIELKNLATLTPGYAMPSYLKALGVEGKITYVIASQPSYFKGFAKIISETPLANWKTYFKWHALSTNSPLLPANFSDEHFAFYGTLLKGVPKQEVRWKRAIRFVDSDLGEAMGKLYVTHFFPSDYKDKMEKLVNNLLTAYSQSLKQLDWMSATTKKEAQKKLATFMPKIGYPTKWRDYSTLTIRKDDLIGNSLRSNEFKADYEINKLGKPIDRTEWGMTPQTVNAYYNPEMNEIVFPAAILQPPFFQAEAEDAVNYGAIGAVIGHEISHGFDDQGSQYDGKGNLRDWWTKQDHKKFAVKTAALAKQYSAFSPLPGYFVNGELTLGENIADNSGLAIALKAYKISLQGKTAPVIDGLTGEQRFYMGFGQVWQTKSRDETMLVQIKTDPHSPAEFRANGTVQNQSEFYKTFDVKKGDKMFIAPENRVTIW
ncbi:MAG: family peptidase [Solimicrobium sp.]|jgi:predicted metalloendopeptidase|nr:family peptidase [Solimicrobium sp.]